MLSHGTSEQLSNLYLVNAILAGVEDLDLKVHHRALLNAAGLERILNLCESFGVPSIDTQIAILQDALDEDERKLRERLDQEILKDLNNPQDVYNALCAKTDGTKAKGYFLSMMQHLLLIHEEGQPMVHYFQLLNSLVTDVVLDKKLANAEQRLGLTVERIIGQFNEADRLQAALEGVAEGRSLASKLQLEKVSLEEEIAQGLDGLVGRLKEQLVKVEDKLNISRETTSRLQNQLVIQKAEYEERIAQLEAQVLELFRMVKEVGSGVVSVIDNGSTDRKALIDALEKQYQRREAIHMLEGKDSGMNKKSTKTGVSEQGDADEENSDPDATPGKPKKHANTPLRQNNKPSGLVLDETSRVSQFMDAEETDAQEQIQQQMAAGVKIVSDLYIGIPFTHTQAVFSSHWCFVEHAQYTRISSTHGAAAAWASRYII
jgi:cytokinesis protein